MKRPFDETRIAKNRDPLDAPDQEFEWEQLLERLSEDARAEQTDKSLAQTVRRLFQILVPLYDKRRLWPKSLGLRLIALAWVLDPDYFPGGPSLAELARRANVTPAKLAKHTGRYSRVLGWRHRGQSHAWNWRKGQRSDVE